jgi:hypothetical protein
MLLTTKPMRRRRTDVWWIVEAYITLWHLEETIRFIKGSYELEDIRLLTYRRLQNMALLVLVAAYSTAVRLGAQTKLRILALHVLKAAKRIFGIPGFRYYALAVSRPSLKGLAKALGISKMKSEDIHPN